MKIQCKLGATEQVVSGTTYVFQPDEWGRYVCDVFDERHQKVFLSVEPYQEVGARPDDLPAAGMSDDELMAAAAEIARKETDENSRRKLEQDAAEAAAHAARLLPDVAGAPASAEAQPPVDNNHVAEGATAFTPEEIAANQMPDTAPAPDASPASDAAPAPDPVPEPDAAPIAPVTPDTPAAPEEASASTSENLDAAATQSNDAPIELPKPARRTARTSRKAAAK